jgi:hypothetical protein
MRHHMPRRLGEPFVPDTGVTTSPPSDARATAWPVGEPGVAGAIGQAFDRRVAAEAEVVGARGTDRPATSCIAQFEQRAAVSVVNRLIIGCGLRLGVGRQRHPVAQPWHVSRAVSLRGGLSRRTPGILPITALRLTPMSSAIWRQVNPASKRLFRSSIRSSVQVGSSMLMVPSYA